MYSCMIWVMTRSNDQTPILESAIPAFLKSVVEVSEKLCELVFYTAKKNLVTKCHFIHSF